MKSAVNWNLFFLLEDNKFFSYIYVSRDWAGNPRDGEEGELKWFSKKEIPLDKMWDDDKYWLPDLLHGKQIKMRFYFDKNQKIFKQENLIDKYF